MAAAHSRYASYSKSREVRLVASSLRVLLVASSDDDAELILVELRKAGYDSILKRVDSERSLRASLRGAGWDIVLCQGDPEGFEGSEVLATVRELRPELPAILISSILPKGVATGTTESAAGDRPVSGDLARLAGVIERELEQGEERRAHREREQERQRLLSLMSLYLHPEVARRVAQSPDLLHLGGERRELTVLFGDLRGFTAAAEDLVPEALVQILSEYLDAMTDIVFAHGGLLDKYMGDGIMALWGAPVVAEDHATRACQAALEMVKTQTELCAEWHERGLPPLAMGIGINTGPMVIGNLGSRRRFSYTALGDHVNLGARLEQLNKIYGTRVLVSEYTRKAVGPGFLTRPVDIVRVRGKHQAVEVFELMASSSESGEREAFASDFARAVETYRERSWDEALSLFRSIAALMPNDGPTRLYVERCAELSRRPPAADWDGVFSAELLSPFVPGNSSG